MSDTTPTPNGQPQGQGGEAPGMRVLAQYLKDLSFENPKAPGVYRQNANQPNMEVNVDVAARAFAPNQYEVELSVSAKATNEGETIFVVETTYAGAFEIVNIPQEQMEPVLLIECPRLLFPFIRQIVSDTTQSGNFPPVMLDPIDFFAIYERRRAQAAAQQQPATA